MTAKKIATLALTLLLFGLAACGGPARQSKEHHFPVLTIHLASSPALSALPFILAQKLGLFSNAHLDVQESPLNQAAFYIGPVGQFWPILGYLTMRPDILLVSPTADPGFRLRALNHLPMVMSHTLQSSQSLAERILVAHHAHISTWSLRPTSAIDDLWHRHRLPWVLVTLKEAERLRAINAHTVVLAWLGASTGPIPAWAIEQARGGHHLNQLLGALNTALWYLHTTPPATVAAALSQGHQNPTLTALLRAARHYQYWPVTTFPDQAAYDRRKTHWDPAWPAYQQAIDSTAARQALRDSGE